jgi:hypothetical protein
VVLISVERYRGNRQLNYWFEEQFWGNGPEFVAGHLWQWLPVFAGIGNQGGEIGRAAQWVRGFPNIRWQAAVAGSCLLRKVVNPVDSLLRPLC